MPYKDPEKQKAYWKARYAANKDTDNARSAQWRKDHPQELAAYFRNYRKEKPHIVKKAQDKWNKAHPTYKADYYWENRPEQLAHITAWHNAHPEHGANYRASHPEQCRLYKLNRQARKKGLPDTWTLEQQAFMFDYWHHSCAICGKEASESVRLSSDHWLALASPLCPGTVAHNMLPLCFGKGGCNNRKNKTHPEKWLMAHFGPEKAAHILQSITAYFAIVHQRFPVITAAAAD